MTSKQYPLEYKHRHVLISRNCLALVLQRVKSDVAGGQPMSAAQDGGHMIFADFLQQNSMCFWNSCLSRSVSSLEYRGFLVPCTLFISGTDFALEVIRSAWARRVLRPPKGYTISKLGDISVLEMVPAPQTHFAPLSEALCKVVADLNCDSVSATTSTIRMRLEENFPEMQVPSEDILLKSLGALIKERKLYCTVNGYFVATPDTYKQRAASPTCERQMLMTNEEAIVKLHGSRKECSLAIQVDEMDIAAAWNCSSSSFLHASKKSKDFACQINQSPQSSDLQMLERSHSLKIMRVKGNRPKSNENLDRYGSFKESSTTKRLSYLANEMNADVDFQKGEKQSMLAKILKRMQSLKDRSSKHATFSAQFPPLEWLQAGTLLCHSVATQTQIPHQKVYSQRPESNKHKIPWEESERHRNKEFTRFFSTNGVPKTGPELNGRKSANVAMRQSHSRHSPSHRYSYGTMNNYSKRRHKHRRSSSESPKICKNITNGNHSQSTESKSPTDRSETKFSRSSSSGSAVPANPKAIVVPRLRMLDLTNKSKPEVSYSNSSPIHLTGRSESRQVGKQEESKLIKESLPSLPKPVKNILSKPQLTKQTERTQKVNNQDSETDPLANLSDIKLALSESSSELSISFNGLDTPKKDSIVRPPVLKSLVDMPKPPSPKKENKSPVTKEIIVDSTVSVEVTSPPPVSPKGNDNLSTTVVTEETTVSKGNGNSKVVTVTSITTSLSKGKIKEPDIHSTEKDSYNETSNDKDKSPKNDLNLEITKGPRIIDCSSSCNIVTEVK